MDPLLEPVNTDVCAKNVYSAIRPGSRIAGVVQGLFILLQGIPGFWAALMLIIAFAVKPAWLPAVADGSPAAVVLPTVALAVPLVSIFTRLLLSRLSEVMSSDFGAPGRPVPATAAP